MICRHLRRVRDLVRDNGLVAIPLYPLILLAVAAGATTLGGTSKDVWDD